MIDDVKTSLTQMIWDNLSPTMRLKIALEQRAAQHLFALSNERPNQQTLIYAGGGGGN